MDIKTKNKSSSLKLISFVKDRKGHDLKYAINSNLLKKEVNFIANTSFNIGLKNTIDWYINNKKWLYKK